MRTFWKAVAYMAFIAVLPFVGTTSASAQTYIATELPLGTILRNNNGALVRQTSTSGPAPEDFASTVTVTSAGRISATYNSPAGTTDHIKAINDSEALVGYRSAIQGNSHALLLANGVATDLHAAIANVLGFDSASSSSFAYDINNSGAVVGYIIGAGVKAFQYKNGVVTDLGAVAAVPISVASSINNFGQIVAQNSDANKTLIYSNDVVQASAYSDPIYGALRINPVAINDAGQVMGAIEYPTTNPAPHAIPQIHLFLYEGGVFKDVSGRFEPTFFPASMNNTGAVVGGGGSRAALYKDGLRVDLTNETDAASRQNRQIINALSINDDGVILADAAGMIVQLTPVSMPQLDPSVFNFESGAQGFESAGQPIVTVATSTTQKFAGEKSLALQFTGEGFAAVRVLNPTVRPGDTITFRIYLPVDSNVEWVQPYALGGAADSWAWHGAWTPVQALQLGEWNTITISIPNDAHPLHAIGLEAFSSNAVPGTIYVDGIDYGVTPDTAQYHFETGTQGWFNSGDPIVNVATSSARVFTGRKSLGIDVTGTGLARVAVENPSVQPGDTIAFRVFIPEGAGIDWIQPFAIEGAAGNWAWHGNWRAIGALQAGAWNTITVDIPAEAHALVALGIELSISQASAGTVYVDSVGF